MQTLPQHRHAELHRQLALLDRTIEKYYTFPEDQALARIPDPQGLGGTLGLPAANGIAQTGRKAGQVSLLATERSER